MVQPNCSQTEATTSGLTARAHLCSRKAKGSNPNTILGNANCLLKVIVTKSLIKWMERQRPVEMVFTSSTVSFAPDYLLQSCEKRALYLVEELE